MRQLHFEKLQLVNPPPATWWDLVDHEKLPQSYVEPDQQTWTWRSPWPGTPKGPKGPKGPRFGSSFCFAPFARFWLFCMFVVAFFGVFLASCFAFWSTKSSSKQTKEQTICFDVASSRLLHRNGNWEENLLPKCSLRVISSKVRKENMMKVLCMRLASDSTVLLLLLYNCPQQEISKNQMWESHCHSVPRH